MDSDKIELLAVNCITDAFVYCNKLKPFIPIQDKEPVWDGHIYINTSKGTYSRIPTQVKGKLCKSLPKKPSYPISILNLKNYKRDGGVLYFVVFIVGNERHPHYASLAPLDLRRLIKQAKGNASISVHLEPLPQVDNDFESEIIEFYFDCKRQTSFSDSKVLTLEDTIQKGYPITYRIHDAKNQVDALLRLGDRYRYIYANVGNSEQPIYVPVGDQPYKLMPLPLVQLPVLVGKQAFFDSYQDGHSSFERIIIIDDFFRININKATREAKLEATLNTKSLKRYINQVKFLYEAFTTGYFNLNKEKIEFQTISSDDLVDIKSRYKFWSRVVDTLTKLHVDLDLIDITDFDDEEISKLKILCSLILDGESVGQDHDVSNVSVLELKKYTVLLFSEKLQDGTYSAKDFFSFTDSKCIYVKGENGSIVLPIFSAVFAREDAYKLINIDFSRIPEEYEKASQYCQDISTYANQDILNIITAYDRQVKKDKRFINAALILCDWMLLKFGDTNLGYIYSLNRFQILHRINNGLNEKEIGELIDLSETEIPISAKWAIHILLGDVTRAERYWYKMTEPEKSNHKKYPIYTLAKNISPLYE